MWRARRVGHQVEVEGLDGLILELGDLIFEVHYIVLHLVLLLLQGVLLLGQQFIFCLEDFDSFLEL